MKVLDANFLIDYLNGVDATAEYSHACAPTCSTSRSTTPEGR